MINTKHQKLNFKNNKLRMLIFFGVVQKYRFEILCFLGCAKPLKWYNSNDFSSKLCPCLIYYAICAMYMKKLVLYFAVVLSALVILSPIASADDGTLNGDGISISEEETEIKQEVKTTDDEGNEIVPEVTGELLDDAYYVDLKMPGTDEFRVVVKGECEFIDKISFKTTAELTGRLKVAKLSENPSEKELKNSIGFCVVELVDVNTENIESMSLRLVASRDELTQSKFDKDSMSIFELVDGKWKRVQTKRVDGDAQNYYYNVDLKNIETESVLAFASKTNELFSLRNLILCFGALVGFAVLLGLGYFLVTRPATSGSKGSKKDKTK
jgi:hypothetical protein